jgi:hypothetical protein
MRNTVTISQEFPTWAAAYEARERLARERGFDERGIDRIDIERFGGRFELLVRTDEFHRDEIEHLLRSSGTMFNPPARQTARGGNAALPLVFLGLAAVAGMTVYALLGSRRPRTPSGVVAAPQPKAAAAVPMFTLEVDGAPIAVTKGNEGEARAIFESTEFRDKLRRMESDGRPLWTGADQSRIRPASPAEIRAFVQYAETLGFEDEEEGEIILYLRPIDSESEFDETQDG